MLDWTTSTNLLIAILRFTSVRHRTQPPHSKMSFPIELVERIIDAASADPPTLAACSLVCKEWLHRSRHHLFASLDLSASWTPEPNAVTEFMKLVDGPNSLVPYVTGVVLAKRSWGMTPIPRILAVLARSGIRPGSLHINCPTYEPTHLPIFSSLVHLSLYLHNDMPTATLIDHVCAFPLLESLYVGGSAQYTAGSDPVAQALPPQLHTLIITDPVFANWVVSLDPVPTQLSTIILRFLKLPEHWEAINRYLTSPAAAGIFSLAFEGCDTYPHRHLLAPRVQALENLQTLRIESSGALLPTHLLGMLSALRGSPAAEALEALELYYLNAADRSTQSQWRDADALLSDKAQFPVLQRVGVAMRVRTLEHPDFPMDHRTPAAWVTQLHENMTLCCRRGIMFVR